MKTLTFNKNSWHYKLAALNNDWHSTDICSYSKSVIIGLLGCIILFIGAIGYSITVMWFLMACLVSVKTGINVIDTQAIAGAVMLFGPFAVFGMFKYLDSPTSYKKKPDSFITTAYKSYKEKFCVKIEFTE